MRSCFYALLPFRPHRSPIWRPRRHLIHNPQLVAGRPNCVIPSRRRGISASRDPSFHSEPVNFSRKARVDGLVFLDSRFRGNDGERGNDVRPPFAHLFTSSRDDSEPGNSSLVKAPREGTPETAGIHNQVVDDHNRMWGTAIDLTLRKLAEVAPLCQSAARGP